MSVRSVDEFVARDRREQAVVIIGNDYPFVIPRGEGRSTYLVESEDPWTGVVPYAFDGLAGGALDESVDEVRGGDWLKAGCG